MSKNESFKLEEVSIRLVKEDAIKEKYKINNPDDAIKYVADKMRVLDREVVCVINLKSSGEPINFSIVSMGALNEALVHPREFLKTSILSNAARVIMLHNHPSGNLTPSRSDIKLTDRLIQVCDLVDIPLLDHIIVGPEYEDEYYSFAEKNRIVHRVRMSDDIEQISFSNKKVSEASIVDEFRNKTKEMFHPVNECTAENFEDVVYNYINSYIEDYYPSLEIKDVVLVGSRSRGLENLASDMDFVFEYSGEMREDEMFNVLNNSDFEILGIPIDINPIRREETGTLEEYLPRAEKYLQSKRKDKDLLDRCQNIFHTHGYPIYIGNTLISFPEEYDDVFTTEELKQLQVLLLEKKQLEKEKKQEFDYKDVFQKAIDEWDKKDIRQTFRVSRTSAALNLIGIADKEITIDAVKINRVIKTHPDMSYHIIKQLPEVIDNPVLIMSSKQSNSRIVVSGELYDLNNKSVVVILELEPKDKTGLVLDEIKIASAYGKKNIDNMILSSKLLYVTDDKEKINRWIKNTGLQLPFDLSSIDSINIIPQDSRNATVEYKEESMDILLEREADTSKHTTWEKRMDDIASDIRWNKSNQIIQKGEDNMAKDNPISVWVGNLRKYNEGNLDGKWLELPMSDEQLQAELDEISLDGRDEIMIFDTNTREDCQYMHDVIHEFDNIHELNVVAKLIGNEPHPAVSMYLEYDDNLSLSELANLVYKEDEINYSPYEFDGVDNPNILNVLSNEEKLGYTMLERNKTLAATLEGLDIDGTSIMNYINVEAIGRDMVLSGYVTVGENGFLDNRYITIDLEKYSIEEINQEINEKHMQRIENLLAINKEYLDKEQPFNAMKIEYEARVGNKMDSAINENFRGFSTEELKEALDIEKQRNQDFVQKTKHISEPTPVGPKL